jgi:NitT/TauT family transport system substrate-binding protein
LVVQAGNPAPDFGYIDLYVAQKAGFFKQEGLDIEIRHASNASQAAQIVASGGADLARFTYEPAIIGYEKGLRGRIFYQLYTRLIYFVAVPDSSPIQTIADLKGKRIGVVNMGGTGILVLKSMLKESGIDPATVTLLPVGKADTSLAALRAGQVDGFAHWDAVYATMESEGQKLRYLYHPTVADVGDGGYFSSEPVIASKHKELAGFARAIAKSTVFFLQNPEAAVRMFWEVSPSNKPAKGDEAEGMRRAVAQLKYMSQSWDVSKYVGLKYGSINHKKLQNYIDALQQGGAISERVPVENIVSDAFINEANNFDVEKVREIAREWK